METVIERLQSSLEALKQLDYGINHGDIQDHMRAIGDFLYESLDDTIYTIESAIQEVQDNEEYIADLEKAQADVQEDGTRGNEQ
jgi:hypothetical protein